MQKKKFKKIKHNKFLFVLATNLAYWLLKLLFLTYRIQVKKRDVTLDQGVGLDEGVFYGWHQNIIASAAFFAKKGLSFHCVVSPSRDGKFLGTITKKLGLKVLYGSAHKKPIVLVRNALAILKTEKQLFLIGDGSRGPAKKLQPGASYLAKKTNLPLVFINCKPTWAITLKKTWDQFQIPLPFSKITVTIEKQEVV